MAPGRGYLPHAAAAIISATQNLGRQRLARRNRIGAIGVRADQPHAILRGQIKVILPGTGHGQLVVAKQIYLLGIAIFPRLHPPAAAAKSPRSHVIARSIIRERGRRIIGPGLVVAVVTANRFGLV